jgi:hypothetical protein
MAGGAPRWIHVSALWFSIGQGWNTANASNGYLNSAITPRPRTPKNRLDWAVLRLDHEHLCREFLEWWQKRYIPEFLRNLNTFIPSAVRLLPCKKLMVFP